jgi:hypothetical protein
MNQNNQENQDSLDTEATTQTSSDSGAAVNPDIPDSSDTEHIHQDSSDTENIHQESFDTVAAGNIGESFDVEIYLDNVLIHHEEVGGVNDDASAEALDNDSFYYRPVRRSPRLEIQRGEPVYQRQAITQDEEFIQIPVYEPSLSRPTGFDVWNLDRPPSPNEYLSDDVPSDASQASDDPDFSPTNSVLAHSDSFNYDESIGSDLSLSSEAFQF